MNQKIENLMKEIINCPNIADHFNNLKSLCSEIISAQEIEDRDNFQIPEPWNGDIENAKILIISSLNPGYDFNENYPKYNWSFQEIKDFFINRFKNEKYTKNFRPVSINGGLLNTPQYWKELNGLIRRLLGKEYNLSNSPVAITEMVHCKSKKWSILNSGFEIQKECCNRYMDRIISLCKDLRLIVTYGDGIRKYFIRNGAKLEKSFGEICIENKKVYLIFLDQPGSNKTRDIEKVLDIETLNKIKDCCKYD